MTNDVKKTNLVGNCEHTREGLELARWEKKTHPGHCPVDNDKDRFPFLSSRPTGHKEVDLLVSLARSERMGKWGAGVRKNDIKGISWEFFISPAFGRVKMIRHTRALPKWFSLRGNIGRRLVGPAQDCRTRISDFRWSFECHRVRSNIILLAICLLMLFKLFLLLDWLFHCKAEIILAVLRNWIKDQEKYRIVMGRQRTEGK